MSDNKELKKYSHTKALAKGIFTGGILGASAVLGITLEADPHFAQEAVSFVSDKVGMAVDATVLKCGALAAACSSLWITTEKGSEGLDSTTSPYLFGAAAGLNGALLAASVQLNAPSELLLLYTSVTVACGTLAMGKAVERDIKAHEKIAEQKAFQEKYSLTR